MRRVQQLSGLLVVGACVAVGCDAEPEDADRTAREAFADFASEHIAEDELVEVVIADFEEDLDAWRTRTDQPAADLSASPQSTEAGCSWITFNPPKERCTYYAILNGYWCHTTVSGLVSGPSCESFCESEIAQYGTFQTAFIPTGSGNICYGVEL